MKRRRKVEIRVERHELSIYASPPAGPVQPAYAPQTDSPAGAASTEIAAPRSDASGASGLGGRIKPESCPICGSQEMALLTEAIAAGASGATSLKDCLEAGTCHVHCSRSGEWWVCGQSLRRG